MLTNNKSTYDAHYIEPNIATTETEQHSTGMEVLKNDLKATQGGIRELLSVLGNSLSVPSWKFPAKQAAEVDIEDALKSCTVPDVGEEKNKQKLFLLELLVDR